MSVRKVIVRFKNVGGAAELPEDKLQVKCNPSDTLSQLHDWLCKWYPESPKVALCIYVKSCFMPALEEEVGALAEAYGVPTRTGGAKVLMLEYCNQPNWGPHYFTAATPSAGA